MLLSKKKMALKLGSMSALAVLACSAFAQNVGKWAYAGSATNALKTYRGVLNMPGVSAAIVKNGKVLYMSGVGWADIEKKIPANEYTIYRYASVSKPLTSIIVQDLVQRKGFNTMRPIQEYLPEAPDNIKGTIRDLLCHQSGIRHYKDGDGKFDDKHYATSLEAVKLFWKDKLEFQPKEKYGYSTHAFTMLGAVLEKFMGKPFRFIATERMEWWKVPSIEPEFVQNRPNRAQVYKQDGSKNVVIGRGFNGWKYPGGGFEGHAKDLAWLGWKLIDRQILDLGRLNAMWTSQKSKEGDSGYGFGWSVGSADGRRVCWHNGEQDGASSHWRVYPDHGVSVAVLSNRRDGDPQKLGRYLALLALDGANASKTPFTMGKPIN